MKRISFFLATLFLLFNNSLQAQSDTSDNQQRIQWFRDAKFGMFIHWGLYAEAAGHWDGKNYYGTGEWLMKRAKIKIADYEKLAATFNPNRFNAEEWVQVAKDAGMKYIVITAKHHDGFAMFKSRASKFNIVDATPFKRDPLKELADACHKAGIPLGFYYSQFQDWREPGAGGNTWEFADSKEPFSKYFENKCKPQVKELLTNYGTLGLIWFDTPGEMTREQSMELLALVRKYQPQCLVSSRVGNGVGDYLDFGDGEIPTRKVDKAWEALFTHNDSWGYVDMDHNWKSTEEVVRMLSEINGKGGNFLLNVGPSNDGTLPQGSIGVFRNAGKWIGKNKDAVYATSYSPFPDLPWGTCTSGPGVLYFHVWLWPQDSMLRIPGIHANIKNVSLLESGESLSCEKQGHDLLIHLPVRMPDPLNTVICLTYDGTLMTDSLQLLSAAFPNRLLTAHAERTGKTSLKLYNFAEEFGDWKHAEVLEGWSNEADFATWTFHVEKAGDYRIMLDYSYPLGIPRREGVIEVAGQRLQFETLLTGTRAQDFYKHVIGVISFPSPGKYNLVIKPMGQGDTFIKLRDVSIKRFY